MNFFVAVVASGAGSVANVKLFLEMFKVFILALGSLISVSWLPIRKSIAFLASFIPDASILVSLLLLKLNLGADAVLLPILTELSYMLRAYTFLRAGLVDKSNSPVNLFWLIVRFCNA